MSPLPSGPVGILVNLYQVAIIMIALIMTQQKQITMARYGSQQVVKIMSYTASQLADCLHLLTLDKLCFECFQLCLVI